MRGTVVRAWPNIATDAGLPWNRPPKHDNKGGVVCVRQYRHEHQTGTAIVLGNKVTHKVGDAAYGKDCGWLGGTFSPPEIESHSPKKSSEPKDLAQKNVKRQELLDMRVALPVDLIMCNRNSSEQGEYIVYWAHRALLRAHYLRRSQNNPSPDSRRYEL